MTDDIQRIQTGARYSRAVIHSGTVYFTGITASDRSADIAGQTRQALKALEEHLQRAGSDKGRLLSTFVLLRDVQRDFAGMNEVWEAWLPPGCAPARATWQSQLAAPDILVELIVTAAVRRD
jgi:enamine deaminase RidA (YjgF/YER057c/UK114 family)